MRQEVSNIAQNESVDGEVMEDAEGFQVQRKSRQNDQDNQPEHFALVQEHDRREPRERAEVGIALQPRPDLPRVSVELAFDADLRRLNIESVVG